MQGVSEVSGKFSHARFKCCDCETRLPSNIPCIRRKEIREAIYGPTLNKQDHSELRPYSPSSGLSEIPQSRFYRSALGQEKVPTWPFVPHWQPAGQHQLIDDYTAQQTSFCLQRTFVPVPCWQQKVLGGQQKAWELVFADRKQRQQGLPSMLQSALSSNGDN